MIALELIGIFTRLQLPAKRNDAAAELAIFANVSEILLFGKDHEIGVYLPAAGLPQTLRDGARWHNFLRCCASNGRCEGTLPATGGNGDTIAIGYSDPDRTSILVFLGAVPGAPQAASITALLPLLGATLASERAVFAAAGHAIAAREASRRAGALNAALDVNRKELQFAVERAERELESRRLAETRLREADRRKDDFLAMLAHELRNPLAPISMAAKILNLCASDSVRVKQSSEIISRQIRHMTRLLDDLLDVSRVTRGVVTLATAKIDLNTIIADAVEQNRPLIDNLHHTLTIELPTVPVWIVGDRTRLVQVITNLLNNAARYTPPGGQIWLRLGLTEQQIELTVSDSGVGISAALLPHVFDLFTQGERSSDRAQGGLGLGLALVKSLVEHHGGSVAVESPGTLRGSQFYVRLPRVRAPLGEGNVAAIDAANAQPQRAPPCLNC